MKMILSAKEVINDPTTADINLDDASHRSGHDARRPKLEDHSVHCLGSPDALSDFLFHSTESGLSCMERRVSNPQNGSFKGSPLSQKNNDNNTMYMRTADEHGTNITTDTARHDTTNIRTVPAAPDTTDYMMTKIDDATNNMMTNILTDATGHDTTNIVTVAAAAYMMDSVMTSEDATTTDDVAASDNPMTSDDVTTTDDVAANDSPTTRDNATTTDDVAACLALSDAAISYFQQFDFASDYLSFTLGGDMLLVDDEASDLQDDVAVDLHEEAYWSNTILDDVEVELWPMEADIYVTATTKDSLDDMPMAAIKRNDNAEEAYWILTVLLFNDNPFVVLHSHFTLSGCPRVAPFLRVPPEPPPCFPTFAYLANTSTPLEQPMF